MKPVTYENYEEGSWDAWDYILTAHANKMSKVDKGAFLPSPEEIEERKVMLNWLKRHEFERHEIGCIMRVGSPSYQTVRELVARVGVAKARHQLRPEFDAQTINW